MNAYITLASVGQGAKKVKVLHGSWKPQTIQPKSIQRGASGKAVKQFAPSYQVFPFVARIEQTPSSGYASMSDVRTWFGSNTTNGNTLTLVDFFGNTFAGALANDLTEDAQIPVHDAGNNFYYVEFLFEQLT